MRKIFIILFLLSLFLVGCESQNDVLQENTLAEKEVLSESEEYENIIIDCMGVFLQEQCYDLADVKINEIKIYNVNSGNLCNSKIAICLMENVRWIEDKIYVAFTLTNSENIGSYMYTPYEFTLQDDVSMDLDVSNGKGWYNITHIYWDKSRSEEIMELGTANIEKRIKAEVESINTNSQVFNGSYFEQGFYSVPEDIGEGKYDVKLVDGVAIVVSVENNGNYNTSMCLSEDSTSFSNLELQDGAKVTISGGGKIAFVRK